MPETNGAADPNLAGNTDPNAGKEGGWKPPSDGSWIPRERFNDAVGRERSRADRAEALLVAERTERATEKAQTPPITRADLQVLVDEGKLTQVQMDDELDRQRTARLKADVRAEVLATTKAERQAEIIRTELVKYKEAIPDITLEGSEARGRVQREFSYLVEVLGEPANTATELKAVRSVFGPSDRIREVTRETRETESETNGGGGGSGGGGAGAVPQGLSQRQWDGFQAMMARGLYKGPDDPALKKDIQSAVTRSRQRTQARA